MTEQAIYGLVFEVRTTAPAEERAKGRLITLHESSETAAQYFQQHWPTLKKHYGDPTLPTQGGHVLPLSEITSASCYGTAYQLADVHTLIKTAQTKGETCHQVHHDATAKRPELYGNEANKLIAQSGYIYIPLAPTLMRTRRAPRRAPT